MVKKLIQKLHIVIILTTLFLSNCSIIQPKEKSYTTLYDSIGLSWINDSNCEGGCLFGVEPGKTLFDKTKNILLDSKNIEPTSLEYRTYVYDNEEKESINFNFSNEIYRGSISSKNNVIEDVYISVPRDMEIATIGQMVEVFGEPDSLLWYNLNPEGNGCYINFLWRDFRMVAQSSDSNIPFLGLDLCEKMERNDKKVAKDWGIDSIILLTQELFNEFDAVEEPTWNGFLEDN